VSAAVALEVAALARIAARPMRVNLALALALSMRRAGEPYRAALALARGRS
jgi:hypothetical protein